MTINKHADVNDVINRFNRIKEVCTDELGLDPKDAIALNVNLGDEFVRITWFELSWLVNRALAWKKQEDYWRPLPGEEEVICPYCEGTGEITTIDRQYLSCSFCRSTGVVPERMIGEGIHADD